MQGYPPVNLDHLRTLTDQTGVIQHAIYSIPNRKTGYTTDDNARALMVALCHVDRFNDPVGHALVRIYLAFLHYAQNEDGKLRNFMNYDQNFMDREGSEDCFGRSFQACGRTLTSIVHPNIKRTALHLIERALPWVDMLHSPRAQAYTIIGLCDYHRYAPDNPLTVQHARRLADNLTALYEKQSDPQWRWFEPILTYCNGSLPAGLFTAAELTGEQQYRQVAEESLAFLAEVVMPHDRLELVGSDGWYPRGGVKAPFDQQPVDADSFLSACVAAYQLTGTQHYRDWALTAFDWFLGRNVHGLPLYDPATGGCYDGLTPEGVNQNQGAESTLAFLSAQLTVISALGPPAHMAPEHKESEQTTQQ